MFFVHSIEIECVGFGQQHGRTDRSRIGIEDERRGHLGGGVSSERVIRYQKRTSAAAPKRPEIVEFVLRTSSSAATNWLWTRGPMTEASSRTPKRERAGMLTETPASTARNGAKS